MRTFGNFSKRWTVNESGMSTVLLYGFLLLGLVATLMPDVLVLASPDFPYYLSQSRKGGCTYQISYNMLHVKCEGDKKEIPSDLKTSIKILELSGNRIRDLTNDSLTPYTSLTFIYLNDNFISSIEEAAFANQYYLEVLDLSNNACDNLPKSLFQLSSLRTLYLSHNKLTDSVFNMQVTSPLQLLQLSKNKLTKIPNIGLQPTLTHLNVSDNPIASISPEDVAQFCSLEDLDLTRTPIRFNNAKCECQRFNAWAKLHNIKMKPGYFNCTDQAKNCINVEFTNRTYELYEECSAIIQRKVETEKARSVWLTVIVCVSALLLLVFMTLFCVHRRNRRRRRRELKREQQMTANNANTELLNSNLKHTH